MKRESKGRTPYGRVMRRSLAAAATVLLPLVANTQATSSGRVFPAGRWNQLWKFGDDTDVLLRPEQFSVARGRVVVFDYGDFSVKAFKLGGGLEWQAGRKGAGPGEYLNPTDIRVDQAGQTVVLDPENARLTVLDPSGKLVKTVSLAGQYHRATGPLPDGSFLALSYRPDTFVVALDDRGLVRAAAPMPKWLVGVNPLAREPVGIRTIGTDHLIAFRWSSSLLQVGGDGREIKRCEGIDSAAFPRIRSHEIDTGRETAVVTRVDSNAREATAGFIAYDRRLAVLASGASGERRRILDIYAAPCGAYQESRRLPFAASCLGAAGDSIVVLVNEPIPHLVMLRWQRGTR